ncbi:hypothetical protein AAE478_008602 [Parahypoxylon ruwenzoriense]
MRPLRFVFACLWFLAAISSASPGGRAFGFGVDEYTCSFLGGAVINVDQEEAAKAATLPAIRTVSAEWNVPWMKIPGGTDLSDPDNQHSLAQWVGILGNACDDKSWYPFLQAGTAIGVNEYGTTTAYAWVEWFPAESHSIPQENVTVGPGDQVRVTIDVYTRITGHVSIQNLNTGREYAADVKADSPEDPRFHICLGYGTAQFFQEWVIANDRAGLPVFNNVTFTNVAALDRRGKYFDLGMGTQDYWNMTAADKDVAIPEDIDEKSFVIYSPEGRAWSPARYDT